MSAVVKRQTLRRVPFGTTKPDALGASSRSSPPLRPGRTSPAGSRYPRSSGCSLALEAEAPPRAASSANAGGSAAKFDAGTNSRRRCRAASGKLHWPAAVHGRRPGQCGPDRVKRVPGGQSRAGRPPGVRRSRGSQAKAALLGRRFSSTLIGDIEEAGWVIAKCGPRDRSKPAAGGFLRGGCEGSRPPQRPPHRPKDRPDIRARGGRPFFTNEWVHGLAERLRAEASGGRASSRWVAPAKPVALHRRDKRSPPVREG